MKNHSCSGLFDSNFKFFQWGILHAQGYLIQSSSLFHSKVREIKLLYFYYNRPAWFPFVTSTFCHAN
ncbi:hypothetical protein GIB67_030923 [Kingdonia uniflora]|uniref:Uncharacterized protein n=1 Tax=Kingdonia uniflora TaxID=39325 RepID=A0A7J7L3K1_9MAGN|nr:hypothetical protein GIB67_030923 [Kingdonia uniflora]